MNIFSQFKNTIATLNKNLSESKDDNIPKVRIEYASFTNRLMANIIDCFILILIITPLTTTLSYYFLPEFHNIKPVDIEVLEDKIQLVQDHKLSIKEFTTEMPVVQLMLNPTVLQKIILLNIVQCGLILGLILICWRFKGNTPGKYITGIMIVDAGTLEPPSNKQFVIRLFGYVIDLVPGLGIGFLWALFNRKHQCWHDKMAGTVVIRQRVNLWQALTERRK